MNRSLVKLLITIVVAGVLGTLIARDPGYVMVSWEGHTLQTGLWVFLGLLAALGAAAFYGYRLLRFALAAGGLVRAWRSDRQRERARRMTAQGLAFFNAGETDRAEKFLKGQAEIVDNPAVNYFYAAKAADARGDIEERERCLRLAVEADPAWQAAARIAGAGMDLALGRHARVIETLKDASDNEEVLRLKSQALLALRDWQALADLMPAIRKRFSDADEVLALQKQVALERIRGSQNDQALAVIFKNQPEAVRHDEDVITAYVKRLGDEAAAEAAIREALNREWLPHLLSLYGGLGSETLDKRLRHAQGWLKRHSDDAELQLCLGRLFEAAGRPEDAKRVYRNSLDLDGSRQASRHLGRLLAFDGNYKESSEHLARALREDDDA